MLSKAFAPTCDSISKMIMVTMINGAIAEQKVIEYPPTFSVDWSLGYFIFHWKDIADVIVFSRIFRWNTKEFFREKGYLSVKLFQGLFSDSLIYYWGTLSDLSICLLFSHLFFRSINEFLGNTIHNFIWRYRGYTLYDPLLI